MTLDQDVTDLKEKVRKKRIKNKLLLEQQKLQQELDEGSIKGLFKKAVKKYWKEFNNERTRRHN